MNLRTLKKLSKRAAPILAAIGDDRMQFPAERDDNYTHTFIGDWKHWERSHCNPNYKPWNNWSIPQGKPKVRRTRTGRAIVMRPPVHPRKGTVMVGSVSGYYEPEWSEETAWDSLRQFVRGHFVEINEDHTDLIPTRKLDTVSEIFAAAADMIAERRRDGHVR